jgi:hypothetical protein
MKKMKLRNIFEDDNGKELIKKQVNNLFKIEGTADVGDDLRVNVEGSATIRFGKSITRLPFKFGHVTGELNLIKAGLRTLEGMPISADTVLLPFNPIQSLEGCEGSTYTHLDVSYTKIKNLIHCPAGQRYTFSNCKNLASLTGLRTENLNNDLGDIFGLDCPNLSDITPLLEKQERDVSKVVIDLSYHVNMPLVGLTVRHGDPNYFAIRLYRTTVPREIWPILDKYRGAGPAKAIELSILLENLGYKNNARLR